ncbi:hypothetical protein GIB67_032649 [Kingdonia uniflora]|uniref:RCC1-like domain-containing protein n=1 Tax=Kingdonia uniflora TaxID=39325 RepID=A0A7J7P9E0_9MAGN|nr:hypothetical protein GIB67_032649 [Kingdonia uniflora]
MSEEEIVMRVYMCGYLPGASPHRSPILSPLAVRLPDKDSWRNVCSGGCGFAMAISDLGKLITWGSTDDMGQSYVTSGKHGETPRPFPLPNEASVVKAVAGWAHCVSVTDCGQVYTWGWKECVPTGKFIGESSGGELEKREQGSPDAQVPISGFDTRRGEESTKRRRTSSAKHLAEGSASDDESLSAVPYLVTIKPGVRIASVAAGGRHTLVLSDIGQVWGWGYGGEGQLGLGSRVRMVSSPHPIPCIEPCTSSTEISLAVPRGSVTEGEAYKAPGSYVKSIACGGRHSAVITDAGALLTFGWGLYGQCGQGSTDDELSPTCVSSLLGIRIEGVAAGLWHSVCISDGGDVYAFGGNQFGQLGTGDDQAEILPKLLEAPSMETNNAKIVSCGARHSALITDDGKVFCWGWNKYGQLGLGDAIDRNIPSQVSMDGCHPKNVACGWWHTLVLAESPT